MDAQKYPMDAKTAMPRQWQTGSGIIGGLTNRAFGSKMNQEKINDITTSNNAINQTMVDSSSNESVAS